MKRLFDSFFTHAHKERISVLYLLLFLIALACTFFYLHFRPRSTPPFQMVSIRDSIVQNNRKLSKSNDENYQSLTSYSYTLFDPNYISADALISMGVPKKVALNWTKYIKRGGRFKSIEDLSKIYGLTPKVLEILKPYLDFKPKLIEKQGHDSLSKIKLNKMLTKVDPNSAHQDELVEIGLPQKIAKTVINYRSKGGRFSTTRDLSKIYGMNDSLIQVISPWLQFLDSSKLIPNHAFTLDMNTADTTLWKRLPGIGSTLAKRIVNYRDKLGGFYSIHQLKEVYGLPDSIREKIKINLTLSPVYKKIHINLDSLTQGYHPYLAKKDALIVENYRKQHGPFKTGQDLFKILAFDSTYWNRIMPYLDFSNSH